MPRAPPRINQTLELPAAANERPRLKWVQVQGPIVQHLLCFRIRRQQDLKTAIQEKALDAVRPRSPADCVRSFEHAARDARPTQPSSAAEARQASADDQHICINHVAVSQLPPLSKHRVRHHG
jgi:hypothetical protein